MMKWFQALMPREGRFFELFDRHAATIVLGAEALSELLEQKASVEDGRQRIATHENEADEITREVMLAVRRTFITPFDRGDIQDLIGLMDDAIDQMQKTAKAIVLFEVSTFEPLMVEMGAVIVKASRLTAEAVALLPAMQQNAGRLNALAEEITRIEEQSDDLYDEGVKALYRACRDGNPMNYIVGAEIYDHLEKVVDRLQDVANRISGILIEHL
jgi:predicted phosphate transport protein (TIGR00153 family)